MERARFVSVGALVLALIIGLSAVPSPVGARSAPAQVPAPSTTPGGLEGTAALLPQTIVPVGPTASRLLDVHTTLPAGTSNSVTALDVDPISGEVFAANEFAATVTVFDEYSGAVLRVQGVGSFSGGAYPAGLLLDPLHHRLFVSISTRYSDPSGGGWMLVLNETTLATEGNVTFSLTPVPPFEPTFLAYDSATDQVFVENATGGEIAVVDAGSLSVTKYLACPMTDCAEHGYGLVNVPAFHTLVVATCAQALWLVNTTNDSTRALVVGPSIGALMAWTAFDSVDQTLWVENYSYFGSLGTFLEYNLSTLSLLADVPGAPPRESGMVYEPADNLLVATNINGSHEIATFRGVDASPVATSGSALGIGNPYLALTVDPVTGVAIAGGPGNGSTVAYQLPTLAVDRVYSSFPLTQSGAAADPAHRAYLVSSINPTALRSENASTGATNWDTTLPIGSDPVGLVVDNATSTAYVADATYGDLQTYDTATGSGLGNFSTGAGPYGICAMTSDLARGQLYVGILLPPEIVAFNVTQKQVVGTLSLSGELPCKLSLDPANHDLIVLSAAVGGKVYDLTSKPSGALVENASWPAPPAAVDVAVGGTGSVYLLDGSGTELQVLDASTGTNRTNLSLTSTPASAIAIDPTDGFLFLAAVHTGVISVIDATQLTTLAMVLGPSPVGALSFDDPSGTLIAPTASTGQVTVATLVPVPSSPTALTVVSGNNSFTSTWGPPVTAGADPVVGYQIDLTPQGSAAGPFLQAGSSAAFQNLTNGVGYELSVAAVSPAGIGTSLARATVVPAGVPYPPTNLTILSQGTNAVALAWNAPASEDGAPIQNYRVLYGSVGSVAAAFVDAGLSNSTSITGLSAGTNYSFEVEAANSVGLGHPSTPRSTTTDAASSSSLTELVEIGAVGAVIAAGVVLVLWKRRRDRRPATPTEEESPGAPTESPDPADPASET